MPDADQMPGLPFEAPFGTFTCKDCDPDHNVHPRKTNRGAPPQRCDEHKALHKSQGMYERLNALRVEQGREPVETPHEREARIAAELDADASAADKEANRAEAEAQEENESSAETFRIDDAPTWLDDDEAQELLRAKREAEAAGAEPYDPDKHGTVEEYLARASEETADYGDVELAEDHEFTREDFDTATERVNDLREHHRDALKAREAVEGEEEPEGCILCGTPDPPHVNRFCTNHWQQASLEHRNILLGSSPDAEAFRSTVRRIVNQLSP